MLIIGFLLISNVVVSQVNQNTTIVPSQFLFSHFTDGVVLMKDGTVYNSKLNYDASTDQMKFIGTTDEIMYLSEPDKVKKVTIANRNFIYIKDFFVEIISEGPVRLCQRIQVKQYTEKYAAYGGTSATSSILSVSSIDRNGVDYKLSSNDKVTFQQASVFYMMNNGKSRIVLKENDLLKCFPTHKEIIKQEIIKQHTEFSSVDSMRKLINWINANGVEN